MSQRDYVSRGRAPQKKNTKKATKKTTAKRGRQQQEPAATVPWLTVAIVVLLLLGFAYFLWSIKDNADPGTAQPLTVEPAPAKDELPELPEEEWEYIKTLPGYEVEVDVAEQVQSDKRYLMQCASFKTRAQADEMRAKIAFQGLEAQIRRSDGANGEWFRVILGPFDAKRDAERAKHSLRKVNITTCQIWYWNL
ncbi:MAG: SPOR domain-containing protein [Alteromonadaceae bacterium]|nr:SPOR domain-containing protein [Alteromonadaceae bacterium]